ncbi:MAG: ATP-binding protein [Hydrogenophaga sp.]|uniref:AAA family ATPase n=1 Tax=Hydrogenophaga sp. TaxID=1904254 RepID=UPI002620EB26|nr:AAA family ATPase [Hydrogenophaga sp.]MCV0439832.1 ATP-binding protein [Hydrogenophaga sp.]
MRKLILMRGPSGTGKSTISAHMVREAAEGLNTTLTHAFHETDQFWTDLQGNYHFQLTKLKDAHRWNQLQAERSMLHGTNLVIVANTFIAQWEMEAYLELAEVYDYEVEIIRTPGPWDADTLFERNKHSVPLDVIRRHVRQYQPTDRETEWTDLSVFQA